MIRDTKFWIFLGIFQILFALIVFGLTRDYYLYGGDRSGAKPATRLQTEARPDSDLPSPAVSPPSSPAWNDSPSPGPAEISRKADEAFASGQYAPAAALYTQLLAIAPEDAETHNNLGLTLYYLGQTTESLRVLKEGIALDPKHQRIRLTLGYVNKQLGNDDDARDALTNASLIGDDEGIRKAAMEMLRDVP